MRLELKRRPRRNFATRRIFAALSIAILVCVIASAYFLDMKTSPMLREVAQSELESIAYDIVGRIVEEELSKADISYEGLVKIERANDGKVTSITTDVKKLNLLKLRISNRLSEEMFVRSEDAVKVPLGNLTGIDFLTGRGPDIVFRTMWVSSVNSNFSNSFESAGINQTRHQIMLDFAINVGMMFVGREIGVDVGTSVCVAETIIVGDIPEYFFAK